ncbi:MAG: DUF5691 domain-containing protein [Bacteroidota bacterium]
MSGSNTYQILLQSAILGTARAPLPESVSKLAQGMGLEAVEDPAEQILQLLPILDRLERTSQPEKLKPPPGVAGENTKGTIAKAIDFSDRELPPAPAKMSKALDLILDGPYAPCIHEYIRVIKKSGFRPPDRLLPKLLGLAINSEPEGRDEILQLAGPRGRWLAGFHADWSALYLPGEPEAEWKRLHLPADQAALMSLWRAADPVAAREALIASWPNLDGSRQARLLESLSVGLNESDGTFLQSTLKPRRRQVRRQATRLLLKLAEATTTDHFTQLIAESLQIKEHRLKIDLPKPTKERLEPYGLYEARGLTIAILLEHLPPHLWWELPDLEPFQFVNRLVAGPREAKDLLPPLAKACVYHDDQAGLEAIAKMVLRFDLSIDSWPKSLMRSLSQVDEPRFHLISDWALDQLERALHASSFLSFLSRAVPYAWSDRLSRASLRALAEELELSRMHYRGLSSKHWLPLAYRALIHLFPEFQRELREATTQYGEAGKLATKMLQTMSFRKRAFYA